MSLSRKPVYRSRLVITANYTVCRDGRFTPDWPERCPQARSGEDCRIVGHGRRPRKCGPGFDFALGRCKVHVATFTIYPPGWVPFGRRPLVELSPSGAPVQGPMSKAWHTTAFGAAIDAASRRLWPVSCGGIREYTDRYGTGPYGVARTQRRHIAGANALFAMTDDLAGDRPRVVAAIGIGMADLLSAATRARDGPEIVALGAKSSEILRALGTPSRNVLRGITRLGVDREYWGHPA